MREELLPAVDAGTGSRRIRPVCRAPRAGLDLYGQDNVGSRGMESVRFVDGAASGPLAISQTATGPLLEVIFEPGMGHAVDLEPVRVYPEGK